MEIIERMKVQEELAKRHSMLKAVIEGTTDAVFVKDAEGRYLIANEATAGMIGKPVAEVLGKSDIELFSADVGRQLMEIDKKIMSYGETRTVEEYTTRGRVTRFWLTTKGVYRGSRGEVAGLFGIARDITELKKSHDNMENLVNKRTEELKASNRELQIAIKEMETFSYSISHDLKAPLRAINGFSNILLEDYAGSLDAEGRRILNVIHTNVVQIRQLIDDILRLSRTGLQPLKKSEIDMKKLTEDIFAELKQECPERTINFHVNPLPSCQGDSVLITQIMRNLLSNAVKFTGQREVAEIEAGSRQSNEKTVYYVKDNGVGFDMKYAEKLFSLFQRLHSPKEFEGTGVGLAIVQRLVHRHGGRIWAEAKVNEGATFFFTF